MGWEKNMGETKHKLNACWNSKEWVRENEMVGWKKMKNMGTGFQDYGLKQNALAKKIRKNKCEDIQKTLGSWKNNVWRKKNMGAAIQEKYIKAKTLNEADKENKSARIQNYGIAKKNHDLR